MTPDEQITHAYQTTLDPSDPRAAQVLGDLANNYRIGATTHVPGDPTESAFREGQRSVVIYILGRLDVPMHPGGKTHG